MATTIKLTKHGVRDLNSPNRAAKHVHRYLPNTYTARDGSQLTQMVCACGDIAEETRGTLPLASRNCERDEDTGFPLEFPRAHRR